MFLPVLLQSGFFAVHILEGVALEGEESLTSLSSIDTPDTAANTGACFLVSSFISDSYLSSANQVKKAMVFLFVVMRTEGTISKNPSHKL